MMETPRLPSNRIKAQAKCEVDDVLPKYDDDPKGYIPITKICKDIREAWDTGKLEDLGMLFQSLGYEMNSGVPELIGILHYNILEVLTSFVLAEHPYKRVVNYCIVCLHTLCGVESREFVEAIQCPLMCEFIVTALTKHSEFSQDTVTELLDLLHRFLDMDGPMKEQVHSHILEHYDITNMIPLLSTCVDGTRKAVLGCCRCLSCFPMPEEQSSRILRVVMSTQYRDDTFWTIYGLCARSPVDIGLFEELRIFKLLDSMLCMMKPSKPVLGIITEIYRRYDISHRFDYDRIINIMLANDHSTDVSGTASRALGVIIEKQPELVEPFLKNGLVQKMIELFATKSLRGKVGFSVVIGTLVQQCDAETFHAIMSVIEGVDFIDSLVDIAQVEDALIVYALKLVLILIEKAVLYGDVDRMKACLQNSFAGPEMWRELEIDEEMNALLSRVVEFLFK